MMVLQFLHQTNLGLLLHGLMGRTVFSYTECIVGPDELHGKFHEGCHTNGGLHVVGEHEEGTAGGDDTTVEGHTDAAAGHGEFCYASLEEGTAEVAFHEVVGLLQETVGLVGVRQVGRGANHVGHLLGKGGENGGTGTTGGGTGLLLYLAPVYLRSLAAEPLFQLLGLYGMTLGPLFLLGIALSHNLLQFLTTLGIQFLHLGENLEGVLGVGTEVLHRVDVGIATERSTMGGAVALIRRVVGLAGSLAHHTVTDDERRALFLCLSLLDGLTNLVDVVAVNLLHKPSPCLVFLGGVLRGHHLGLCGELDVVGIVEHDEVVETEVTGDTACTLRNLFLHATIGDVGVDGLVHHAAQTGLQKLGGNGGANGEGVTLTERTGGVLDTALNLALWVSGGD